jgi:FixJ family two-component response regulator
MDNSFTGDACRTVYLLDQDNFSREAVSSLLRSVEINVDCFSTSAALLSYDFPDSPSCILLDTRLPEISGFSVQAELSSRGNPIPLIFLTAHADVTMSVRAMKAGAFSFLTKPCRDQELLDTVEAALRFHGNQLLTSTALAKLRLLYSTLTRRESQVMSFVAKGLTTKQIASSMQLTANTIKVYRNQLSKKMECRSLADLIKSGLDLGLAGHRLYECMFWSSYFEGEQEAPSLHRRLMANVRSER